MIADQVMIVLPIGYGALNDRKSLLCRVNVTDPQPMVIVGGTRVDGNITAVQRFGVVVTTRVGAHAIFTATSPFTVTSCKQKAELPAVSIAVQVMVVVPIGNGSFRLRPPGLEASSVNILPQLSNAVGGVTFTILLQVNGSASTRVSAAQVIYGGWISVTLTVKLQISSGFRPSLAVQVTVVTPLLN